MAGTGGNKPTGNTINAAPIMMLNHSLYRHGMAECRDRSTIIINIIHQPTIFLDLVCLNDNNTMVESLKRKYNPFLVSHSHSKPSIIGRQQQQLVRRLKEARHQI